VSDVNDSVHNVRLWIGRALTQEITTCTLRGLRHQELTAQGVTAKSKVTRRASDTRARVTLQRRTLTGQAQGRTQEPQRNPLAKSITKRNPLAKSITKRNPQTKSHKRNPQTKSHKKESLTKNKQGTTRVTKRNP
jgi:hypothetical protein